MAYASQQGRARVNPSAPEAAGQCYRCGFTYTRRDLTFQRDWRGPAIQNTFILVCPECYDTPQEQLRSIILPADPVPIKFPSVPNWVAAETDYHSTTAPSITDPETGIPIPQPTLLLDQDGNYMVEQPIGIPANLDQNAVMPLENGVAYRVTLRPTSITSVGTDVVTVTFPSAHGLATNDQIVVQGLSNRHACGAYSITVTTATAFTYQVNVVVASASLLTSSTLMVTASIGIPYGFDQIPQTGV